MFVRETITSRFSSSRSFVLHCIQNFFNCCQTNRIFVDAWQTFSTRFLRLADAWRAITIYERFIINDIRRCAQGGSDTASSNSHNSAPSSPALFMPMQPMPATASAILNKKQQFDFSADIVGQDPESSSSVGKHFLKISKIKCLKFYLVYFSM